MAGLTFAQNLTLVYTGLWPTFELDLGILELLPFSLKLKNKRYQNGIFTSVKNRFYLLNARAV